MFRPVVLFRCAALHLTLGSALALLPAASPAALPPEFAQALARAGVPADAVSVMVTPVPAAGGAAVTPAAVRLSHRADASMNPASVMKLITTYAGLDLLGTDFTWTNRVYVDGPVTDGVLDGNLIIRGSGDPKLVLERVDALLRQVMAQGVREVRGDIVLDRSAFRLHTDDHARTPEPGPDRPHHVRPDALTLDEGVLHVNVQPARATLADVQSVPRLAGVKLMNKVTMAGGCHAQARWATGRGEPELWVEGSWAPGCGLRQLALVPPLDAGFAARAVATAWSDVGGRLIGRVREGDLPVPRYEQSRLPLIRADGEAMFPWSTHLSDPLPEVIHEINKTSNNLAARHLMLSLSRGFPMRAATLAGARESVRGWLGRQGLAAGDIELENGSGLSRAERGKPRALVQLLCNAWSSAEARSFIDSLPVAGVDGTLQHRLQRGLAAGRAYLKTGTLLDTRALAGYVQGASGRLYAVAALVNHPEAARGTPALDALIEWVARNG